jgi:hypothetical protein
MFDGRSPLYELGHIFKGKGLINVITFSYTSVTRQRKIPCKISFDTQLSLITHSSKPFMA